MDARAVAHAKNARPPAQLCDMTILIMFSRSGGYSRPYSARQSIALIMKMILNILIVSVSLKVAEINRLEVTKNKSTLLPPPCLLKTADNTGCITIQLWNRRQIFFGDPSFSYSCIFSNCMIKLNPWSCSEMNSYRRTDSAATLDTTNVFENRHFLAQKKKF